MGLLEEFQEVVQCAGGRLVGDAYYGIWAEYPFTAYVEKLGGAGTLSFSFRLERRLPKQALQGLRRALPRGCRLTAEGGHSLQLLIRGRLLRLWYSHTLDELLDGFTGGLRETGAVPPGRCPLCRQDSCDAYADIGGYVPVHRCCVEAMNEGRRERVRSGPGGFFGALLGGGLVSLLVLIFQLQGWPGIWLYFFLPLGAWYGYRVFGGAADRRALFWSGAASVLDTLIIEQALFYSSLHFRYKIWPSIFDTFFLYWQMTTVGEMLDHLWLPAVCLLAGFLFNWMRTRSLAQAEAKGPGYIRATMAVRQEGRGPSGGM